MELTIEKISKNTKKFFETAYKYSVMNENLEELLGQSFIKAPCTTGTNLYNAYEGGLIQHILNTTKYAVSINNLLPETKQVNIKSLIRVCLVHQIGKTNMFVEQESKWHRENRGEMYKFNEDVLSMSVAERSIYYALKSGVDLTEDEVFAIYNYNSDFAHRPMTSEGENLAALIKISNLAAIMEQK